MDPDRRLRVMRRLAWSCVLLMLVVTAVSAVLRLTQPREACEDWPACRRAPSALAAPQQPAVLPSPAPTTAVRAVHRLTATLALLCAVALVYLALARRPRDAVSGRLALGLLLTALALSALGVVTPGSRAAPVLLGNLLGGMLMLALAWRLTRRLAAGDAAPHGPPLHAWPLGTALLWALQSSLGALSGAGDAPLSAPAHLMLAVLPGVCALEVGRLARRSGLRAEGTALLLLAPTQWLLGGASALLEAPAALVVVHNTGSAVVLALLLGLVGRPGTPTRA